MVIEILSHIKSSIYFSNIFLTSNICLFYFNQSCILSKVFLKCHKLRLSQNQLDMISRLIYIICNFNNCFSNSSKNGSSYLLGLTLCFIVFWSRFRTALYQHSSLLEIPGVNRKSKYWILYFVMLILFRGFYWCIFSEGNHYMRSIQAAE